MTLTLSELRGLCAALPHSQETFPFGPQTLVFKVAGKVYALTSLDAEPPTLSLKVRPLDGEGLRATYPQQISPGYHLNKRHWVTLRLGGAVPDALVRELLAQSYALVLAGMSRAERAEVLGHGGRDRLAP